PDLADRPHRQAARAIPRHALRLPRNAARPPAVAARVNTPLLRWLPLAVARAPASVYTKLLVSFLAIVGLLMAIGMVSLAELGRLNQRAEDFVKLQRKVAA